MAAVGSVNIDSPLLSLRDDNWKLLSKLRQGQDDIWEVLARMKTSKPSYSPRTFGETTFTYRGTDRTPVKVYRKHDRDVHNGDHVSTPKNYVQALAANGNDRRNRTPMIPNSILTTPESRRKKVRGE